MTRSSDYDTRRKFCNNIFKTSFINIRNGYGIFSERSGKNHKCLKPLHQIKIRIEFASIPSRTSKTNLHRHWNTDTTYRKLIS